MATQHSTDFRESLVGALDAGLPMGEAVTLFDVSLSTLYRWRKRKRETGSAAVAPGRGRRSVIGPVQERSLGELVAAFPDATLDALGERFTERTGLVVSRSTVSRRLQAMGITRKKRRSLLGSGRTTNGRHGGQRSPGSIPPI